MPRTKKESESVIIEEVEDIEVDTNMVSLERSYNEFREKNKVSTLEIVDTIKMMELDNVQHLIFDAKTKIELYSKGEPTYIDDIKSTLTAIPYLGKKIEKMMISKQKSDFKKESINDVFKGLFKNFSSKQERILELADMLQKMRTGILSQTPYLTQTIAITDSVISNPNSDEVSVMRAKRLNEMANTTLLKNRDKVDNKINPGLMLAAKSIENLSRWLPSLEADAIDELGLNGALNSIKDLNIMLKETMTLVSNITEISSKNTEDLMLEVIKISDTSDSIKYFEESQKRRTKFINSFEVAMTETAKKQEENYKKVKTLSENYKTNVSLSNMLNSYSSNTLQIEQK